MAGEMEFEELSHLAATVGASGHDDVDRLLDEMTRGNGMEMTATLSPPVSPAHIALVDDGLDLDLGLGNFAQIEDGGCLSPLFWDGDELSQMHALPDL